MEIKAKTLPIFSGTDVNSLTDAQVMALIFKPGFSTTRVANLDAGRGVGLSLVKNRIEESGGNLKVRTGKVPWSPWCFPSRSGSKAARGQPPPAPACRHEPRPAPG